MKCLLCSRTFLKLGSHLLRAHNISGKDYYDKFLKKSGDGVCYCGNNCSFISPSLGYNLHCSTKCSSLSEKVQFKKDNTCICKYGVLSSNQSKTVKDKMQKSMIDKYGVKHASQNKMIQEKCKQTNLKKYGVDHYSKTPQGRTKQRIRRIIEIENQKFHGEPIMPTVGIQERPFLNELQYYTKYQIIRNDPSFRYIIARFPDGHILELKLFIQFDERAHFEDIDMINENIKTIQETKDLESISDYKVFRVSEKDWKENKESIIQKFREIVAQLESKKKQVALI